MPRSGRSAGVRRAAEAAFALLTSGGNALDAVELAVRIIVLGPDGPPGFGRNTRVMPCAYSNGGAISVDEQG